MEIRWLHVIFSILLGMTLFSIDSLAQGSLCHVSSSAKLAIDQRDDLRMRCLKQKKLDLNISQCLQIANSMEYSINAEEARGVCMETRNLTAKGCLQVSQAMEYADSGDESRWECLRQFNHSITHKQCRIFAKNMSYPANEQRAKTFCDQELH